MKNFKVVFNVFLILFGIIELIVVMGSSGSVWCLWADAATNMFAGYALLVKDRSPKKHYRGFLLLTHTINAFWVLITFVFIVVYAMCVYAEITSGAFDLDNTIVMLPVAMCSVIVNVFYVIVINKKNHQNFQKSSLVIIAVPVACLIAVLLFMWIQLSIFNHIVGLIINILLLARLFKLMDNINGNDTVEGFVRKMNNPNEEIELWQQVIGEEKTNEMIDVETQKLDNEKLLNTLFGDEILDKIRQSSTKTKEN